MPVAPRIMRLDELTPEQRRLVEALLNAQRHACEAGDHKMVDGRCKYESGHRDAPQRDAWVDRVVERSRG
jgi:hypothetical protein